VFVVGSVSFADVIGAFASSRERLSTAAPRHRGPCRQDNRGGGRAEPAGAGVCRRGGRIPPDLV